MKKILALTKYISITKLIKIGAYVMAFIKAFEVLNTELETIKIGKDDTKN